MAFDYIGYLNQQKKNAATGANTAARPSDYIDAIYNEQIRAQTSVLDAQKAQQQALYNQQLAMAPEAYQGLRNEAYTQAQMAERTRRENMANMGLSGAGGMSQTLQQRNQTAMLNALGSADRQQQKYTDDINLQMGNLETQYGADLVNLIAQAEAARNQAMMESSRWESQFALEKERAEADKKNAAFEQAWNLYNKGYITSAQFQKMTGISVQKAKSSRSSKQSSSGNIEDFLSTTTPKMLTQASPNPMDVWARLYGGK